MVKLNKTAGVRQYQETLNAYLGPIPDSFNYNGKSYTSRSFAHEYIGINPDNYIEITSYNHHPFHSRFILEIPANWNK